MHTPQLRRTLVDEAGLKLAGKVALETPDRVIRLSFKTEAREKWRVLIDEGRRGYVYLVTLGDDVTPTRLAEMAESRLVVYVPRAIKESEAEFRSNPALRRLDDLPGDLRPYVRPGPARPAPRMIPLDGRTPG